MATVRAGALGIAVVAAGYLAVALARGGYSPSFQAIAGAAVWWGVVVGIAFGLLPRRAVPAAALASGSALAGLGLLIALSAGWASDDGRILFELVRVSFYLGVFCLVVLTCGPQGGRTWLLGLASGLGAVAVLAVGSRLLPSLFPEQDLSRFLPASRVRLSYPVNYWNGLGAVMAAAVTVLAWAAGNARPVAARAVATAVLPLAVVAIYFTSSRGGAGAAVVGLVVVAAAARDRLAIAVSAAIGAVGAAVAVAAARGQDALIDGPLGSTAAHSQGRELALTLLVIVVATGAVRAAAELALRRIELRPPARAVGAAIAAGLVVVALLGGLAAGVPDRLERLTHPPSEAALPQSGVGEKHFASDSGSGRFQFWEAGWDAFRDHPVGGLGAGGYQAWWLRTGSLPYAIRDAHSLFVETLAELGLVGLLLVVGFLGVALVAGTRRRLRPGGEDSVAGAALALGAAGVVAAAIDWTWELPAAFVLVVVAAGLLTGPATAAEEPEGSRYGWGLVTIGAGFVALLIAALVLVDQAKLSDSRAAARAGNLPQAAQDAAEARVVVPWAAAPRLQEALVAEQAGDLLLADRKLGEAVSRAPDDWRLWLAIARVSTRRGDVTGGARALRKARALNPRSPLFAGVPR